MSDTVTKNKAVTTYKNHVPKTAILKRITGLQSISFKSKPSSYGTDAESHNRRDMVHDGEFIEDFDQNVIGGAVTGLAAFWNDLHDTFWVHEKNLEGEGRPILDELVDAIKVRYPDDWPEPSRRRQIIKSKDVDPTNFLDPFFQSDVIQSKQMVGGRYVFKSHRDPVDALLHLCYSHDNNTLVRGDNKEISKYVHGRAKFELIMPVHETAEDKADLKMEIKTLTILGNMPFETQRYIAQVMKIRGINDFANPDPDKLLVELGKTTKLTSKTARYGMSPRNRFIQLAEMPMGDLMVTVDIVKGVEYRIITSERGEFFLNMEKIEGVSHENELYAFFKKDGNGSDKYKDLVYLVQEKEKK